MQRISALIFALFVGCNIYGATRIPGSLSLTDVQTTVNASAIGDVVQLPSGTAIWTSALQITNAITLRGMGTNHTWITNAIGNDNSSLIRISSKAQATIRIRMISIVTSSEAPARAINCAVEFANNYTFVRALEISDCLFIGCQDRALNIQAFGVVSHCTFIDCYSACWALGGKNGGDDNWTAFYPIAFNSTNYLCLEDCRFVQTASYNGIIGPYFGSQGGAAYIVRNCTFDVYTTTPIYPFDVHGNNQDRSVRGTIGWEFYNNTITYHVPNSVLLLWDIRGGSGVVYSNTVTGAGTSSSNLRMREEDAYLYLQSTYDGLTNVYMWNNTKDGSPMNPFVMANESTNVIRLGTEYFTNSPVGYTPLTYPHPLSTAGTPIPTAPTTLRFQGKGKTKGNAILH